MSSSNHVPYIKKLKGAEDYQNWSFACKTYLKGEGLWKCVEGDSDAVQDEEKMAKATQRIVQSVDESLFSHIINEDTPKKMWDNLAAVCEDKGLNNQMRLIKKLINTKLNECSSTEVYVERILSLSQQLNNIGFTVSDEWIGTLLLLGLPDKYEPMVMGLQASGTKITGATMRTKILATVQKDDAVCSKNESNESAFLSNRSSKGYHNQNIKFNQGNKQFHSNKKHMRCYKCGKFGHLKNECRNKSKSKEQSHLAQDTSDDSDDNVAWILCFSANDISSEDWYLDSGATQHMSPAKKNFMNFQEIENREITVADNNKIMAVGIGEVQLKVKVNNTTKNLTVNDVLYVPQLAANLISISKLSGLGLMVAFKGEICTISTKSGKVLGTARKTKGMYKLDIAKSKEKALISQDKPKIDMKGDAQLWHKRLGHINQKYMMQLNELVDGYKVTNSINEKCQICLEGKQSRKPFKSSTSTTSRPLELVHTDLNGPMKHKSIGGCKYFIIFVDDFSRYTMIYFLKKKSEVKNYFEVYKNLVENQLELKIKAFRSDNGTEYINNDIKHFLESAGIELQTSCPYTPEQNGVAERKNRSITEKAKCMLFEANMPKRFWAEASGTATYLLNRSPTSRIDKKTPIEAWSGVRPNLKHLKIFGCEVMVGVPKQKREKWDKNSVKHIFLGYYPKCKNYKLFNPQTNQIVKSRECEFFENKMYFKENETKKITVAAEENEHEMSSDLVPWFDIGSKPVKNNILVDNTLRSQALRNQPRAQETQTPESSVETVKKSSSQDVLSEDSSSSDTDTENIQEEVITRPRRNIKLPARFRDYVMFVESEIEEQDPQTWKNALEGPHSVQWREAMSSEMESLEKNKTWDLVDLPKGKNAVSLKWVFKIKRNEKGDISKFKARLVARGFMQKYGSDFRDTFSPVVRYSTLRFLLGIAVRDALHVFHFDIETAFLNGDLHEEIYVQQPAPYIDMNQRNKVLKLNKSLYGLKQSSKNWNEKLVKILTASGFTQISTDMCVFILKRDENVMYVAVYVDDLVVSTNSVNLKNQFLDFLKEHLIVKDFGELKYFLNIQINQSKAEGELCLRQNTYIQQVLQRFNMQDCNSSNTPLDPSQKLSSFVENLDLNAIRKDLHFPYQECVGTILYLSQTTRPDICYAACELSRYNKYPAQAHVMAVKRVLRYLKQTQDLSLCYSKQPENVLVGYADADWANDEQDRKSISGYVFMFMGAPISWRSKKQKSVATSTCEAEYIALEAACKEAAWLKKLIKEIDPKIVEKPTKIYCDNAAAIQVALDPSFKCRTKHLDTKYHYVRDVVLKKEVVLEKICSKENLADIMTKPLFGPLHQKFTSGMGLQIRRF